MALNALGLAIALVLAPLLAPILAAEAQQAKPVYRIGFLRNGPPPETFIGGLRQGLRELGYVEAGEFVWAKRTTEREGNEQILRVYETALVFTRAPLLPPAPADLPRVWCVAAGYDDEGEAARWGAHPNHKPFAVLEPLVRQWSLPGNLVLDPFAGSGSIPAAALRLERRVASSEIEPEWAARVSARLAEAA